MVKIVKRISLLVLAITLIFGVPALFFTAATSILGFAVESSQMVAVFSGLLMLFGMIIITVTSGDDLFDD